MQNDTEKMHIENRNTYKTDISYSGGGLSYRPFMVQLDYS